LKFTKSIITEILINFIIVILWKRLEVSSLYVKDFSN
jgi:hypothetical protein